MISINNLTVAYGGFTLLNEINFHISESDKIGLVGKNGAGKSTILKLICGLQTPTNGKVAVPNDVRIGYLPQIEDSHIHIMRTFGVHTNDPVTKNIGSGINS